MNPDFGQKQQCQQILNWNAGASIRHKPHPPAISSQWQLHHVAPLGVVVVPDLVGEQCNLGQPCRIAWQNFQRRAVLTVQTRACPCWSPCICLPNVADRQACWAWQLVLELHQRGGQESWANSSWCYTLRIERITTKQTSPSCIYAQNIPKLLSWKSDSQQAQDRTTLRKACALHSKTVFALAHRAVPRTPLVSLSFSWYKLLKLHAVHRQRAILAT